MPRVIAPAGTPISLGDLVRIAFRYLGGPGPDKRCLRLRRILNSRNVFSVNSGRTGLTLALHALADMNGGRREVILPAYTCFSVAASVVRAGLKIRTVNIDPHTLDYDFTGFDKVDFSRVLAIVGSSLFGVVNDWDRLRQIARDNQTVLIDDAAQSFGASYRGTPCGHLGDIGFYSLGRGKNITTYSGGLLVTDNDEIADAIDRRAATLPREGLLSDAAVFMKISLYALLLRPWLYWLPARLPFLRLGETVYEKSFPMARLGRFQLAALETVYPRLDEIKAGRIARARRLAKAILPLPGFDIPGYDAEQTPAYIRLPVMARDAAMRDAAIAALAGEGIMASTMYPGIIPDIPEVKPHLVASDDAWGGARMVAERLLTLPTHAYVSDRDSDRMAACLETVARAHPGHDAASDSGER